MRRLALGLGLVALLGLVAYAASSGPPAPAPAPLALPEVDGYYALLIGHGEEVEQYSLGVKSVAAGHAELELLGVAEPCRGTLSPEGRCSARLQIPADPESGAPAEVWILEGKFVAGQDDLFSLEGDFKIEVEGRRSAILRRFVSYYEGALAEEPEGEQ